MKIKIEKLSCRTKKKDGTALLTKNGDPYFNVGILPERTNEVVALGIPEGKWISGFAFQKPTWSTGDEIEVDIEKKGEFWNFRLPKKGAVSLEPVMNELAEIKEMVRQLLGRTNVPDKEINVDDELTPDDLPF